MPDHQWDDTRLRFQEPDGHWGPYVDLRGPQGPHGIGGGGGFSISALPAASDEHPDGFLVVQNGRLVLATYAQMYEWFGGSTPANAVTVNGVAVTVNGEVVTDGT